MTSLFASLSVGRAWEKLSSFLRLFSSAPSSSSSATQDDLEELRKLERTMLRIRATLHDAEEHWNIREESAKLRLRELKDLAYDMEDVVDGYEYEVNRCKIEALERSAGTGNTSKRKRQQEINACSVDIGVVAVPNELVLEVRRITERFNEMAYYSEHFTLSEYDGERRVTPDISSLRHTGSVVSEKGIHGRDYDLHNIIQKVLPSERNTVESHVAVMAIVGMGGLGKTTLAQLVYNNARVRQAFDKFAWVCVSERFDVKTITRNIISSLTKQSCQATELSDLLENLAAEVREKRILLVLDDVWNERRDCWELLCMPMSTTRVCQIIVTTRSEAVARLIQTMPSYHPNCLNSDESWSLFKQVAFSVDQEEDIPANLMEIGKSIARRCKGLPLAIKTLGSMLRYESDQQRWEDVLESVLWDLEQPRNEVLPALELSYRYMPTYLRRCFLALSLLQKEGSVFLPRLIGIWKSLDLLQCNKTDDKDAVGKLYMKELVQSVNPSRLWKQIVLQNA
ncbi:hypothetical protein ACP70R_002721 [Stipagrostis hirtigluma subsp. patula]